MITSKQRAYLRSLANKIPALYQIGKGGITDELVRMTEDALEGRELIKFHVLETSPLSAREACYEIQEKTYAEGVQIIGNKFVIYRPKRKDPVIVLPK